MNAGTWRGRTVAKSRRLTVATVTMPSRPPRVPAPRPLVLIEHGGGQHKKER
jgi:hypothetical protein